MKSAVTGTKPGGPYSPGVIAEGRFRFVSGQTPQRDGKTILGTIEEETTLTLENIGRVLESAGASFADVVRCNVYLTDLASFGAMNAVYESFFPSRGRRVRPSASHCSTGCRSRSTAWSSFHDADGERRRMRIVGIEAIVLGAPAPDRRAADQTHEAALVRITSDEGPRRHRRGRRVAAGREGIHRRADVVLVESGESCDVLLGEDPRDPRRLWSRALRWRPSGLPGSASAGSPSPASTWRSGISRARRSGRRSGSCSAGSVPSRSAPSHDVQRPERPRRHDPQHERAGSTGRARTASARPRSRPSPRPPRTTTRSVELVRAVREHAGPRFMLGRSMSATAGTTADEAHRLRPATRGARRPLPRDTVHARAGRRVPPARRGRPRSRSQAPRS